MIGLGELLEHYKERCVAEALYTAEAVHAATIGAETLRSHYDAKAATEKAEAEKLRTEILRRYPDLTGAEPDQPMDARQALARCWSAHLMTLPEHQGDTAAALREYSYRYADTTITSLAEAGYVLTEAPAAPVNPRTVNLNPKNDPCPLCGRELVATSIGEHVRYLACSSATCDFKNIH